MNPQTLASAMSIHELSVGISAIGTALTTAAAVLLPGFASLPSSATAALVVIEALSLGALNETVIRAVSPGASAPRVHLVPAQAPRDDVSDAFAGSLVVRIT